jgi:CRISPR system Cascade subunit CasC
MFVQIHMLQSMPPGNLNRDDTGQPKKCIFGGVTRGRISSQCLKRNMRLSSLFEKAFGGMVANRTKYLPRLVADELLGSSAVPAAEIDGVKAGIASLFKKEAKSEKTDDDTPKTDDGVGDVTPQLVFFPPPFAKKVAGLVTDLRKNNPAAYKKLIGVKEKGVKPSKEEEKKLEEALTEFKQQAFKAKESLSVDVGLFGRMTTSDLIADVEAACQVAHAISTHESLIEGDYFTAMDDRQHEFITSQTQRGGAAFLGSGDTVTFFNSAVYYKYLNVDTDALEKTLGESGAGQATKAAAVLIQAAALATPTGKQNSFAAHSVPELILVEVSSTKQPISYANAFLEAVEGTDLMQASAQALGDYCGSIAAAYAPADTQRFLLAVGKAADVRFPLDSERLSTLSELTAAVEKVVTAGAA